jgi:hypothetical protein
MRWILLIKAAIIATAAAFMFGMTEILGSA